MATIRKIANIRLNEKDFNAYNTQRAFDNIVNNLNLALQQIADNAGTGTSGDFTAIAETPVGTINGSNVTFTLSNTPAASAEVILTLNGLTQRNGIDYTITNTTITFASAPATSTEIFAQYNTSAAAGSVVTTTSVGSDQFNIAPAPVAFGGADFFILPHPGFSATGATTPDKDLLRCRPVPLGRATTITAMGIVRCRA